MLMTRGMSCLNLCVECVCVCLAGWESAPVCICIRARGSVDPGVVWVRIASVLVCL